MNPEEYYNGARDLAAKYFNQAHLIPETDAGQQRMKALQQYAHSPAPTRKQRNEFRAAFGLPPLTRTPRKLKKLIKKRANNIARNKKLLYKFLIERMYGIAANPAN